MSWLRSAVNRAVEVGGKSNISKTVRSYADSVVLHAGNAVAEGAKIIQDRIGSRNLQSFRLTVKRLEEVSVSCRGIERVQLLRRWLVALKETDRLSLSFSGNNEKELFVHDDQSKDSPRRPTMIYYVDADLGTMNFRDVFLYSQALEGMTLSMILEAPNEEEVSLLLELFGLCLAGGKEVHKDVLSSIQDLAASFANYEDEVLVKREELLQYAQAAVAGLKLNADITRIDAEASKIMEKLDKLVELQPNDDKDKSPAEKTTLATEALKETVGLIRLYPTLEALLLRKKSLSNGDSQRMHDEKVDKLKVLSESLLNSTKKAESRILEHRSQKEEALSYRVTKAGEVSQLEKDLAAEIRELEKQKGELEVELQRVTTSLNVARARLHNAQEERQHFDEASNELLVHLKVKEEEISRSIASCRVEADVVNRWVKFLEDTWALHSAYAEQKENQVNGDLERYGDYFLNLVIKVFTTYKEELEPAIIRFKEIEGDLHLRQGYLSETAAVIKDDDSKASRKKLEEQYLDFEAKFLTSLSVVDTMKRQFYTECEGIYRKDDGRIKDLFNAFGKIKEEFESIERPVLDVETPKQRSQSLFGDTSHESPSSTPEHTPKTLQNKDRKSKSFSGNGETVIDTHLDNSLNGYSSEEIGDWVFDELETERK